MDPDTDYAAPLRPMIDPLAGKRSVGEMPSTQEGLQAFGRSAAEPFGQLGRLMTGRSQDPLTDIVGVGAAMVPIGPPGAAKILGKLAKPAAEAVEAASTGGLGDFIKAYHGSPHDFERFDISKIGSGEGAQAYGHGLYFAENEGVAKSYRDIHGGINTDWDDPKQVAGHFLAMSGGDRSSAAATLEGFRSRQPTKSQYNLSALADAQSILKAGDEVTMPASGKMYQVAIKAHPEHFLDWDKPLSEQHPKVISALERHGLISDLDKVSPRNQSSVEHVMDYLKRGLDDRAPMRSDADAVNMLHEAGIPGIKYLDQGSRLKPFAAERIKQIDRALAESPGAGTAADNARIAKLHAERKQLTRAETRNYVVFDDKLIDILKKYGIAGIGALPAMNAYHYQDRQ